MNRLRVLLVADHLPWVLGTWAKQIARVEQKHDYYLFSQQMLLPYAAEWDRLVRNVDVVHFLNQHDIDTIAVPTGLPTIMTITHVVDWEEVAPLTRADAVVVIAEEWKAFLEAQGVAPERIWLYNIGVDTGRFLPSHDKGAARKRLGIASTARLVGYSAKFSSDNGGRKGVDVFSEAVRVAAASGHRFGVVITGPGWDAAVRQLERSGIEVYYRPFLPERLMPSLHNALDLYVVTSRIEGGPAPLIESMACGVPVVTTPVGLAIDYVRDGVNGLVVPKDRPQATAQAIMQLLASPELRCRLAGAGLQTVESQLTWERTLAGIGRLYEQVWQARGGTRQPDHQAATIDAGAQRRWALNVDTSLWHQQLYYDGYHREGLRGMLKSGLRAGGRERVRLLARALFTISPAAWQHQWLRARSTVA